VSPLNLGLAFPFLCASPTIWTSLHQQRGGNLAIIFRIIAPVGIRTRDLLALIPCYSGRTDQSSLKTWVPKEVLLTLVQHNQLC
jgi:hypothetical protein